MRRGLALTAFILVGGFMGYSDAITSEGEVVMASFTIAAFIMILLMEHRQHVRFPVHWAGDGQFGVQFREMGHEHKARLRHLVENLL